MKNMHRRITLSHLDTSTAQQNGRPNFSPPLLGPSRARRASVDNDLCLTDIEPIIMSKMIRSLSGISLVIDKKLKSLSELTFQEMMNIRRCVIDEDIPTLARICSTDNRKLLEASTFAIEQNNTNVLKALLKINLKGQTLPKKSFVDEYGVKLLCFSTKHNSSLDCSRVILEMGISPNSINPEAGTSAMHLAAKSDNVQCLQLMYQQFNGIINDPEKSLLISAVEGNALSSIEYLVDNGVVEFNVNGKFFSTALHKAAENNQLQCAELLLRKGAAVNAPDVDHNNTALHVAAHHSAHSMVRLLLNHGADPNALNNRQETPLHLATIVLDDAIMLLLLHEKGKVNATDKDGRTPLHFCVNRKHTSDPEDKEGERCLKVLLDNGANINIADSFGMTALHLASINKNESLIHYLIRNGADMCAQNSGHYTGFYFAIKHVPSSLAAVQKRMDLGIRFENPDSVSTSLIKIDFESIAPKESEGNSEVILFDEVLKCQEENPFLLEKILLHPLSQVYLQLKWSRVKWLYALRLLFHFLYSVTYSVYTILVFKDLCKPSLNNNHLLNKTFCDFGLNSTIIEGEEAVDNSLKISFAKGAWVLLIIFNLNYLAKETSKFFHLEKRYFKDVDTWMSLLVIFSFPLISFHVDPFTGDSEGKVYVRIFQFHVAGIGSALVWLLQMSLIGKMPRFGKYVNMFKNVIWTFSNFFFAYIFIFIAFAVSFYILFPTHSSFEEVLPAAIVKVVVMMLGELEYEELYYPKDNSVNLTIEGNHAYGQIEDKARNQLFKGSAHFMVLLFILLVSMIIMNLLFGLAVNDIQKLYKKARLLKLTQQVELIKYMENIFLSFFKKSPNWLKQILKSFQGLQGCGKGPYKYVKILDLNDIKDKTISSRLKKELLKHCQKNAHKIVEKTELENEVAGLSRRLNKLEESVNRKCDNIEILLRQLLYQRANSTMPADDASFASALEDAPDSAMSPPRNRETEPRTGRHQLTRNNSSLHKIFEEDTL